jgi:hypothetical protein
MMYPDQILTLQAASSEPVAGTSKVVSKVVKMVDFLARLADYSEVC